MHSASQARVPVYLLTENLGILRLRKKNILREGLCTSGNPPGFESIIVSVPPIITAPESIPDGSTAVFMTDPGVCSSPAFKVRYVTIITLER
jgi:hypothetical protein